MKTKAYLLVGDPFLADEKAQQIIRGIEASHGTDVTLQNFYLKDTPLSEILSHARTLPFLANMQVFRIKDAQQIKKNDMEVLSQYLDSASPATCLIFQAETMDKRTGLLDLIAAKGEAVLLEDRMKQGASARLIREKLRQFNKRMSPAAERRLEEAAGEMPSFLDSILNQLILYAEDAAEITEEMLEKFEEKLSPVDVFHLVDAVSSGHTAQALRLFNAFADENAKDLLSFVGLLHWQLRRLWCATVLIEEGMPENAVLSRCKVSPGQAKKFLNQARKMTRSRAEKGIETLFQMDRAIKTGRQEDRAGIENWIIRLSA